MRNSFEEASTIKLARSTTHSYSCPEEAARKWRCLITDYLQQIVNIQKRKKMLAQVTFAEGPLSETGISLGTLQVCVRSDHCSKTSLTFL
jgi:hypothetical protein